MQQLKSAWRCDEEDKEENTERTEGYEARDGLKNKIIA